MAGSDHRGVYWPITAYINADFKKTIRIKRGGLPVNLTSDTFEAKVIGAQGDDTTVIKDLAPTAVLPYSSGTVEIDVDADDMDLTPGVYWWYWRWFDSDEDDLNPLFYGPFTLELYP